MENVTAIINQLIYVVTQGSLERVRLTRELNQTFADAYMSGAFDRMCKASTAMGDSSFRHSMSAMTFRSGFKISILNDDNINGSDVAELAKYILASTPFVRQLMALGFDTLIIIGKHSNYGVRMQLSKFSNPTQYFID